MSAPLSSGARKTITYREKKQYQYTLSRLNKEKYYEKLNNKKKIAATKAKNLIDKSINYSRMKYRNMFKVTFQISIGFSLKLTF